MTNLILAIMCSSGNSLILKYAETKGRNKVSLLLINYVVAVCFGATLLIQNSNALWQIGEDTLFVLSLINGVLYVSTFFLLKLNIRWNGATLSASLSHMGLLIPVLFSIILFGEYPNANQMVGILLAVGSLIVISFPYEKETGDISRKRIKGTRWLLIPMLLSGGFADTMSKIFEVYCNHDLEDLFLSITYSISLIICVMVCLIKKEKIDKYDLIYGILLGISNYLSTKFLIRSIYIIPAYMAYISYGLGVVCFVNIVNLIIMHEALTRRDYIGIIISMGAIVLLNLT